MRKKIINSLTIVISLALGSFFIWLSFKDLNQAQVAEIKEAFKTANYWWLIPSAMLGILAHIVRAERWSSLLETIDSKPKRINAFGAVMVGYIANLMLPRAGELARCGVVRRYKKDSSFTKVFGTVMAERAFDTFTFALIVGGYILLQWNTFFDIIESITHLNGGTDEKGFPWLYIIIGSLLLIIIILLLFRKQLSKYKLFNKIYTTIDSFWTGLLSIFKIKSPLKFIIHTLLMWTCYIGMFALCFFCIPETSSLGISAAFAGLIVGTVGIIIVQGGIGIYPLIIAKTFLVFGVAEHYGLAFGWLSWSIQNIIIIVLGVVAIIILPLLKTNNLKYEKQ